MKKRPTQHTDSNTSLKTFYIYAFLVCIIICVSLLIKGFYVIQSSRFDSSHHFTLAVTQNNNVKEIISFHPQIPSFAVLIPEGNAVSDVTLVKDYGIVTDGYVQISNGSSLNSDAATLLWSSILQTTSWNSNLTIYDKIRLLLLAKSVTSNNKIISQIALTNQNSTISTQVANLLIDDDIATENVSIQIINATGVTGLGQRLSRVLSTLGANVISVTTAQNTQEKTTITYYGNRSYTVARVEKLIGALATNVTRQTLANIVITIGEDKRGTEEF